MYAQIETPQKVIQHFTLSVANGILKTQKTNQLETEKNTLTGSIIIAKHRQRANDLDTWCVHGNKDHALLFVPCSRSVSFAHKDTQLASWVKRPCNIHTEKLNYCLDIFCCSELVYLCQKLHFHQRFLHLGSSIPVTFKQRN